MFALGLNPRLEPGTEGGEKNFLLLPDHGSVFRLPPFSNRLCGIILMNINRGCGNNN